MTEQVNITVENRLITEERDINVYHYSTRSSHIISHSSSVTLPLRNTEEGDYLHISVVSGPGDLRNDCRIDLPTWVDFELSTEGKVVITHQFNKTRIRLPPGPPSWQLRITKTTASQHTKLQGTVIIGD